MLKKIEKYCYCWYLLRLDKVLSKVMYVFSIDGLLILVWKVMLEINMLYNVICIIEKNLKYKNI